MKEHFALALSDQFLILKSFFHIFLQFRYKTSRSILKSVIYKSKRSVLSQNKAFHFI